MVLLWHGGSGVDDGVNADAEAGVCSEQHGGWMGEGWPELWPPPLHRWFVGEAKRAELPQGCEVGSGEGLGPARAEHAASVLSSGRKTAVNPGVPSAGGV